jgi:hypothetical protein
MSNERQSMDGLAGALRRARGGILIIAVIYVVSVAGGMVMAHRGLSSAVGYRDAIVARAHRSDPAANVSGVTPSLFVSKTVGAGTRPPSGDGPASPW